MKTTMLADFQNCISVPLLIKSLNPTKAHGFDNISVFIIQLCGDSNTPPLAQIFKWSLSQGVFQDTWKMVNIIAVHKKEGKYLVKNQKAISYLPIFVKVFERLFSNFHDNKCHPGFMPGDSCISLLLSTVHEIQLSFYYITSHPLTLEQYS